VTCHMPYFERKLTDASRASKATPYPAHLTLAILSFPEYLNVTLLKPVSL
jgi:hypothetical protein